MAKVPDVESEERDRLKPKPQARQAAGSRHRPHGLRAKPRGTETTGPDPRPLAVAGTRNVKCVGVTSAPVTLSSSNSFDGAVLASVDSFATSRANEFARATRHCARKSAQMRNPSQYVFLFPLWRRRIIIVVLALMSNSDEV